MKMQHRWWWLMVMPGVACAHPGHDTASFMQGMLHPWSGLDHVLAMLAVGMWAAHHAGKQRWSLPLCFVGMMLVGAYAGIGHTAISDVEQGIAASVLLLGLLIARGVQLPMLIGMALVGGFAVLHGYAHGVEAYGAASLAYFGGFSISTLVLHGMGWLGAQALLQRAHHAPLRWAGMGMSVCGAALMLA